MTSASDNGFSLLELLLVIAIIAILLGISYPLYTHHLIKSQRLSAKIALLQLADQLENYFLIHQSYQDATLEKLGMSSETHDRHYALNIISATQSEYVIQAIPVGQQTNDKTCGRFILNSQGQKSISGIGSSSDCW